MNASARPIVIKAELPTDDVVIVATDTTTLVFADTRVPPARLAATLAELDDIVTGPAYALS